jgi:hypothetical protein
MQTRKLALLVAASLGLAAGLAQAQEFTLEDVSFGEQWFGPEVTLEDCQGRVVLLEMWGRN